MRYLRTDLETNSNSPVFKNQGIGHGAVARIAPKEAHGRIGAIERRHAYLRTVYDKLFEDSPSISKERRLSLKSQALNDIPNSNTRLCPTTPVCGSFPKTLGGAARTNMIKRFEVIRYSAKFVSRMIPERTSKVVPKQQDVRSEKEVQNFCTVGSRCSIIAYRESEGRRS